MKFVEKRNQKVFTKKLKKDIISRKYNPLKVNIIYEREGLFMRETNDIVLSQIVEETNFIKRIMFKVLKKDFIEVYKKGLKEGFNWSNSVR